MTLRLNWNVETALKNTYKARTSPFYLPLGGGRELNGTCYTKEEKARLFSLAKMAQGAKKFKAQRPGISKKQHNNKQKGPKKGGSFLFFFKCGLVSG